MPGYGYLRLRGFYLHTTNNNHNHHLQEHPRFLDIGSGAVSYHACPLPAITELFAFSIDAYLYPCLMQLVADPLLPSGVLSTRIPPIWILPDVDLPTLARLRRPDILIIHVWLVTLFFVCLPSPCS